jgi:O-antigen/teichoic acid export membrane protein
MARRQSRSPTANTRGPDSIIKNAASSFVAQMTTASLTAVLTLFLVRALGATQYGLFAVAIGVSTIAISLADLGISTSTSRFVAEHRGRDQELPGLIADALKLKVVLTGVACALLAALASVIASAYGDPQLVWPLRGIALATFGQSTFLMLCYITASLGRAAVNVRLVAFESVLEISASVALVLAGAGATGAAFGRAIGYVFGALIAAVIVLRLSGHPSAGFWVLPRRSTIRRVGMYARSTFAIDASYTLSSSLSVVLLGLYAGSTASGIFQAPAKLIVLIQYVGFSAANGVGPRLSRGPGQQPNVEALGRALRGLILFQCLALAPALVWATPITHLLLGRGYSQSADVLRALVPYIFFCGLAPLVTTGVTYMGEAGRRVPIALATLALVAVGGLILIPSHGVVGAAIATDVAFAFYTLAHVWLCRRLLQLRIRGLLWSLACGLTAATAMGIVLWSVGTKHLTVSDWLIGGLGGLAIYIAVLRVTRQIRREDIARAAAAIGARLGRPQLGSGFGNSNARGNRSPAATPPAWLNGFSADPGEPGPADAAALSQVSGAPPERPVTSGPRTDGMYQIAWRPKDDTGVFELRPVEAPDTRDPWSGASAPTDPSPSVSWRWRIAPAPLPEARRAHDALVNRLLATGWRRAGTGDAWFAHRFQPPTVQLPTSHSET